MDLKKRDLYEEMKASRRVIDYLADRSLAADFYRALCNVKWYLKRSRIADDERIIQKLKGEKEQYCSCSWGTAGTYIADIRNLHYGKNENYMEFYWSGDEGRVTDLVRECFDKMGWIPVGNLED